MALTSMLIALLCLSLSDCLALVLEQIAFGVDLPSPGHRPEILVDPPTVRSRVSLVFEARSLQRHAAGVLADRADRPHLLGAQARLTERGQLSTLVLDRAGARAALLDEGRSDAAHRRVGQVPGAGELEQAQPVALGVGAHALKLLAPIADPAGGAEPAVVVLGERMPLAHVVVEQPAIVDHAGDHADAVRRGGVEHELAGPGLER